MSDLSTALRDLIEQSTVALDVDAIVATRRRRRLRRRIGYATAFVVIAVVALGSVLARPVHEITTVDVAAVLRPVWRAKPEVARKLYPAIRRVFEHARVLLRDEHDIAMPDNPALWAHLKAMGFETPAKLTRGSHPSLPYPLMPEFVADLRARDAIAARALEFLILTNVRTDAVLKATSDQFALDQAVWTVPLVNLNDRRHRTEGFRVPLVERAIEIVRQMRQGQVSRYVFPGQTQGKPLSNMALLTLLKRMNAGEKKWLDPVRGRPITAHGFRATFRTWAEEVATFPHTVIEQAMGHQVGTQVERAYRRTDVLDKRRALMEAWAQWCEPNAARRDYVEPFAHDRRGELSMGGDPISLNQRVQGSSPCAPTIEQIADFST